MKILLYTMYYYPENIGISKYNTEMAEWLVNRGHDVRVICSPPSYPLWEVFDGYRAFTYKQETIKGVRVRRAPVWVPKSPTGVTRILYYISYIISSLPVILSQIFWRPDRVLTVMPPLMGLPSVALTTFLARATSWAHIQDLEVDIAFDLGMLKPGRIEGIVRRIERILINRMDTVSSISPKMVEKIQNKGIKSAVQLFPNWVDTNGVKPDPVARKEFRSKVGLSEDQFVVLYSGNIGRKQGLEDLITAAVQLRTVPNLAFLIVGDGPAKETLQAMVNESGLDNVHFRPLVPLEELGALLASADLHIILQKRDAADLVLPSKLTGILAAGGTAIITAETGTELGDLIEDNPGIAIRIEPESSDLLTEAIATEVGRPDRESHNSVARAYAKDNLSMQVILDQFERAFI